MRILITNFHSIDNKGDLGIVEGLISGLRQNLPTVEFCVVGRDISDRQWWQDQGVDFCLPLLPFPSQKYRFKIVNRIMAICFILEYFLSIWILSLWRILKSRDLEWMKTFRAYQEADLVISKGGSFFREPQYLRNILPIGIMGHLHQLEIARALGKKIVLAAQSFGPINNQFSRMLIARAFSRYNLIVTRDSDSLNYLKNELGVTARIISAGDTAFMLQDSSTDGFNEIKSRIDDLKLSHIKCVGVTVRSWSNKKEFQNYLQSIIRLIESNGAYYFFMPQVIGPSEVEDDRLVGQQIYSMASPEAKQRIIIVDIDCRPGELLGLYAKMDYYIATRFHSSIFALLQNVPCIAIGYEPKTVGVFSDLGLQSFVVDIRDITPQKLADLFDMLKLTSHDVFVGARMKARSLAKLTCDEIIKIAN